MSCDNSSSSSSTRLRAQLQNISGTDTLTVNVWLESLNAVKVFLNSSNTRELTFDHLTGVDDNDGNEIRETFLTQAKLSNLCQDVVVESVALIIQAPAGIAEEDISVDLSQAGGDLDGVTVEAADGNVMATPNNAYVLESGKMLFLANAPAGFFDVSGWVNFLITISNITFTDTFQLKGVIAVKLKCDDTTYYAPIIPATFNFADVPPITITKGEHKLDTPTKEDLPAPNTSMTYITGTNYSKVGKTSGDNNDDNDGLCFIQSIR